MVPSRRAWVVVRTSRRAYGCKRSVGERLSPRLPPTFFFVPRLPGFQPRLLDAAFAPPATKARGRQLRRLLSQATSRNACVRRSVPVGARVARVADKHLQTTNDRPKSEVPSPWHDGQTRVR